MSELDLASSDLWLEQAVGHRVMGTLDKADALALTAKIKSYVGVTWVLIAAAHEHKAHKALGYATWEEYVGTEFDMSRSRSYQLISQAKVVLEISEVVSTTVDISERQARDLEPVLDEAKAVATEAAKAAAPEDKQAAVNAALDRMRESMVAAKRPKAPAKPTTTVVMDPDGGYTEIDATGEILSTATSGSDQSDSSDAAGPGDDERPASTAPSPAPKVAPKTAEGVAPPDQGPVEVPPSVPPTLVCPTCGGTGEVQAVAS